MISLTEARRIITESVQPLAAHSIPLAAAQGRVLAEDVLADAFYPSGDRSMMDGYAIPLDAAPGDFRVTGEIQAGEVPRQNLLTGDAVHLNAAGNLLVATEMGKALGLKIEAVVFNAIVI